MASRFIASTGFCENPRARPVALHPPLGSDAGHIAGGEVDFLNGHIHIHNKDILQNMSTSIYMYVLCVSM